ncbi:MAG: hypothetical protein M3Q19_08915 [Pseudomonadota bacterium]|nr:hypothetical protein [Pseudomonadota bacterium]
MATTRKAAKAESKEDAHPLDGRDEWVCYDQHIAERSKLIECKRNAEDAFVKTIIQLSSAIALLVPSFVVSQGERQSQPSGLLIVGLALVFMALIGGLSEQFLSSVAYGNQITKTDNYYAKKISDVSPPAMSKAVTFALFGTFFFFLSGVIVLSIAILIGPWR